MILREKDILNIELKDIVKSEVLQKLTENDLHSLHNFISKIKKQIAKKIENA